MHGICTGVLVHCTHPVCIQSSSCALPIFVLKLLLSSFAASLMMPCCSHGTSIVVQQLGQVGAEYRHVQLAIEVARKEWSPLIVLHIVCPITYCSRGGAHGGAGRVFALPLSRRRTGMKVCNEPVRFHFICAAL